MTKEMYCKTYRSQKIFTVGTISLLTLIGIIIFCLGTTGMAQTETKKSLSERAKLKFEGLKEFKLTTSEKLHDKWNASSEELTQVRMSFDDSFAEKLKNQYQEVKRVRLPFDLSVYRGKARASGLFGIGGEYTSVQDDQGNEITSVSAGSAILFRGSAYRKVNHETGEWVLGSCYSPGSEGGFSGVSYTVEGDICVGSGNRNNLELTLGGGGSMGGRAMGVQLLVFEWEKDKKDKKKD